MASEKAPGFSTDEVAEALRKIGTTGYSMRAVVIEMSASTAEMEKALADFGKAISEAAEIANWGRWQAFCWWMRDFWLTRRWF